MAEVGSAFVSILPSAKGFGSKLSKQVEPETKKTGSSLGSSLGKAFAIAGGAAAAVGFVKGAIGEAREAQKVGALTAQVIKSTGGAANVSAGQVGKLAEAISRKTGIDDETIQSGQNMLLTFKNIRNEAGKGNDIFNQTSKTLVDMSAAMGKDPKTAAIALGKALNDPIKGVSALGRVGVTFTEKQKGVIKSLVETGHTAEAQKIILKELNSEFGGAAAAQATAGDKARVAFANLQETVGTALLPVLDRLASVFSEKIAPAITKFIGQMQSGQGAGGRFAAILGTIGSAVGKFVGFINNNKVAVAALLVGMVALNVVMAAHGIALAIAANGLRGYLLTTKLGAAAARAFAAVQWLVNAALSANPIGLVVIAIAALVVGLVIAYKKSATFRAIVNGAFKAVAAAAKFMVGVVKGYFRIMANIWLTVVGVIIKGAAKAFGWIPGIGGKLKALARGFDAFKANVNRALGGIHDKKITVTADTGAASAALAGIQRQFNALDGARASVSVGVSGGIGANARGTNDWRGGLSIVGERGPELVNLPKHSQVIPNHRIAAAAGGAGGVMQVQVVNAGDIAAATDIRGARTVAAYSGVTREAVRARR